MIQTILDFLSVNRVGALTVVLPDGTPHSAAMHYSLQNDHVIFYFSASNDQRKYLAFQDTIVCKASVVVGFSEEEWKTVQMEGNLEIVSGASSIAAIKQIHYTKIPGSQKFEDEPGTIFLAFTPTWWRYTDFNTNPLTIIEN